MNMLGLAAASAAILAVTTAKGVETPQPAVWSPHALIVDLRNLPKPYSCDDLWYKFKDVLLAIGARPDLKILPYRCSGRVGSLAYSPKVQLEFSTPRQLSAKDARWANIRAVTKSITLEPGAPSHLDSGDCALLSQIKSTLLNYLGDAVTTFHLACEGPPSSKPLFSLTVQALTPVQPPTSAPTSAQALTPAGQSPSQVARAPPTLQGGPARSGS